MLGKPDHRIFVSNRIIVYEIGPVPGNCDIRLLAELQPNFRSRIMDIWISGDRAYIHLVGLMAVWDFVDSRLVLWAVPLIASSAYEVQYSVLPLHINIQKSSQNHDRYVTCVGLWSYCRQMVLPPGKFHR